MLGQTTLFPPCTLLSLSPAYLLLATIVTCITELNREAARVPPEISVSSRFLMYILEVLGKLIKIPLLAWIDVFDDSIQRLIVRTDEAARLRACKALPLT